MKKVSLFIICLIFLGLSSVNAQIDFGVKAGINYNSESIKEVKTDVFDGAKSKTGFHAGIWTRFKLPVVGLYIRPELIYTKLNSETNFTTPMIITIEPVATTYSFQKIDMPVLLGKKFLKFAHVFAGPSFQYILDSDFNIDDLKEVDSNGFSVGLQFGAGVELGDLQLDVRWERAFSNNETEFLNRNTNSNFTFDTRVNQIIIGLSYKF